MKLIEFGIPVVSTYRVIVETLTFYDNDLFSPLE